MSPHLFTGTHVADDSSFDCEAVAQGREFHVDDSVPLLLGEAADVLPSNVLQSVHMHVELALKEGTHCRDEPALPDHIPAGHGELIPSHVPSLRCHPRTYHFSTGDVEGARFCLFEHRGGELCLQAFEGGISPDVHLGADALGGRG